MVCDSPVLPIYTDKEYESSSNHSKSRSKVWDVFQKISAERDEDSKAICRYCKKVYSAKPANGTSHLRRHLESCLKPDNHDRKRDNHEFQHDYHGIKQYKVSHDSLTDVTLSPRNYKNDLNEISSAIAMMIVTDKQAFRMVEDMGFKSVMAVACPEFEMMSKGTIKRDIISIYMKEREKVRELLTSCPGRICLTSATWKSIADDHYNCVTVHFIDHEWRLQKRILWFNLVPPPYDSLYVVDEIALCMVQWNIEHKFFSIALDNLSTNDQVASMLRSRLDAKLNLSCNGAFFSVGCCSQVLNSIVQAGFDLITDIIGKLRLGVKYVKQSPQRKKNFYNVGRNLNVDMKKLCLDSPTRWNTVYNMLETAVHYKSAFLYMGEWDKNFKYNLSEEEWEKVNILCKFLKVFYEVTCMFFGTRYPTSNLYFKGVWKIHNRLLDVVKGPENFMTGMLVEMQVKFSKYWSENNLVLSCAAILDPRYKVKFIEYCYTKLYRFDAQQHVGKIVRTLFSLFDEYLKSSACSSRITGISVNVSNDKEDNDEFEDYKTFRSSLFRAEEEKSELDRYLEEPSYDLNSEIDVLEYWKSCSIKYPKLSRMARDVLTIPVSTVDPESAFSMGSRVISPCRSSLKPKTIRAMVCLQDWVQTSDKTWNPGYLENEMEDDNSSSSDDADDY
ncbi:hypothetical protein EZV62_017055 [Acer yangbiense]|uniref:BED-type domain-containing protein n=1 Tax=Acer yangbiense TaxID=1000413 RepID=A0A5C7HH88_9ROSI|nr:hypothetical protein EZV62_017055 [Acer yangbiense]